jgi:hypothetical protein
LGLLQEQGLICLLNHPGNQEKVNQLADAKQTEREQPNNAAQGFAVVKAMDTADPHEGKAPKAIAESHAATLVEGIEAQRARTGAKRQGGAGTDLWILLRRISIP